jgi:hypothetical protein
MLRAFAGTETFEKFHRERKRVEMRFPHLKHTHRCVCSYGNSPRTWTARSASREPATRSRTRHCLAIEYLENQRLRIKACRPPQDGPNYPIGHSRLS